MILPKGGDRAGDVRGLHALSEVERGELAVAVAEAGERAVGNLGALADRGELERVRLLRDQIVGLGR